MKKIWIFILILLSACNTIQVPESFVYKEIPTSKYTLASWQKITNPYAPLRIYIEGDGHAFNYDGQPTDDPTPHGTFLRKIAFNDPNPNVVYLARPCQFVEDAFCSATDWTTGRFSYEIVASSSTAIQTIVDNKPGNKDIILIGYSGGALLSGLIIENSPALNVKEWITIAGLLNHTKWTERLNLAPLSVSMDLYQLPQIPQRHYIGTDDPVIPADLFTDRVPQGALIVIDGAGHDKGFEAIIPEIYE